MGSTEAEKKLKKQLLKKLTNLVAGCRVTIQDDR